MNNSITFQIVANQFKTRKQYDDFISQCLNSYDLKVYRVNTMNKQQAINYYNDLKDKYDSGIYKSIPTSWYQNERRLFIWLLVCYIKFSGIKSLNNQHNWLTLSGIFFEKDIRLLKYQYMNILKKGGRVNWNENEDQILIRAYHKFQKGQWNEIAKELFFSGVSTQFKSPKHCRERWNNHLNKDIKKDPWTDEEDLEMLTIVRQRGKKWSQIAKYFNQKRTQHQIKNRFNSLINHSENKESQEKALNILIEKLLKKKECSKLDFFNNISVKQEVRNSIPIIIKKSFQQIPQKRQHITLAGTKIIYSGKANVGFDHSLTTGIEQKLFGSHFLSQIRSENCWLDKSMLHTPGHHFFEDSSNFQKRLGDSFRLSQKGSMQKSEFAASMQFFKLPKSEISQQYKMLSSSSSDIRTGVNYDFSSDIKEL